MSKGTTTAQGLIGTYFANIFGPPQYQDVHEGIARRYFEAFFERDLFVGELSLLLNVSIKPEFTKLVKKYSCKTRK